MLVLLRSSLLVDGMPSLDSFRRALTPFIVASFRNSLQLSLTTAVLGVTLGTLVAYALPAFSAAIKKIADGWSAIVGQ